MKKPSKLLAMLIVFTFTAMTILGTIAMAGTNAQPEIVTSAQMVQAVMDANFGKITSLTNFDYEILYGNVETKTFHSFTNSTAGPSIQDAAENPGRMLNNFQVRGGAASTNSNIVFRITAKANVKLSITFEGKSDWASGYLRTLSVKADGTATEIDKSNIAAGTGEAPVIVNKTVNVQLSTGDSALFYFGHDTADWQTIGFTSSFTADPAGYVPVNADSITSAQMAQAVIDANFGKVTSLKNFDYEILYGNVETKAFNPFTNSAAGPTIQDAAENPGRMLNNFQIRGGTGSENSNVVFRITAKANVKFSITFEGKSDWATGYLRTLCVRANGTTTEIDKSDIAAGTGEAPVIVNKTVDVQLSSGDSVFFYFGHDSAVWQTIGFTGSFTADPDAYVAPVVPEQPEEPKNTETITSAAMLQAVAGASFGKVTSLVNFDYEILYGNVETNALNAFTNMVESDLQNVATGDPGCKVNNFQIRGGAGSNNANVVFRITAKKNVKYSITFEAKSDWASGYLRTLAQNANGLQVEIDKSIIAAGTSTAPVTVNKTVEVQLQAGDSLLFYFANDLVDWQTIYFTSSFMADPSAYNADSLPKYPAQPQKTETVISSDMIPSVINSKFGKVTSQENFDYEILYGDASKNSLKPFTNSTGSSTIQDAAENPGRMLNDFQIRGGKSSENSNVAFRITAKKSIKFSISFEAKSDWATGYFKTVAQNAGGAHIEIDKTAITAGTIDSPVTVTKTVDVQLKAGDSVLFYFGNDTADWQTVYFKASFKADLAAYSEAGYPNYSASPATGQKFPYAYGVAALIALSCTVLAISNRKSRRAAEIN